MGRHPRSARRRCQAAPTATATAGACSTPPRSPRVGESAAWSTRRSTTRRLSMRSAASPSFSAAVSACWSSVRRCSTFVRNSALCAMSGAYAPGPSPPVRAHPRDGQRLAHSYGDGESAGPAGNPGWPTSVGWAPSGSWPRSAQPRVGARRSAASSAAALTGGELCSAAPRRSSAVSRRSTATTTAPAGTPTPATPITLPNRRQRRSLPVAGARQAHRCARDPFAGGLGLRGHGNAPTTAAPTLITGASAASPPPPAGPEADPWAAWRFP
jgi:hypothetical protein